MHSAPSILIVDDEPVIRTTLSDLLDLEGIPTQAARNGAEALELVQQNPPALVLLDLNMPVLDGWGFARELASRGIDVPIVVMSAGPGVARAAEHLGAVDYLVKPFDLSDLFDTIERFCNTDL